MTLISSEVRGRLYASASATFCITVGLVVSWPNLVYVGGFITCIAEAAVRPFIFISQNGFVFRVFVFYEVAIIKWALVS